jgi:hypothetical protein
MSRPQTIVASDGRLWTLPDFVRPPDEAEERDRLLAQRYFLVRQGSLGEIFRCRECKGKHSYLTLRCVERPFSGIAQGLWAYYQTAGRPGALARMTPAERKRIAQVSRLFAVTSGLPDLATGHPLLARAQAVAERDILLGGLPLGMLEEIPASLAQRYVTRINSRLPLDARLILPGLGP